MPLYIGKWIEVCSPTEEEKRIVGAIMARYYETGQKRIPFEKWPDDLMKICEIENEKEFRTAIASLCKDRSVFVKHATVWFAEIYTDFLVQLHAFWHEAHVGLQETTYAELSFLSMVDPEKWEPRFKSFQK
ncbi:MAG: hypothetical protein ACYCPW_08050 [Nitrososphaerales archaeon]